MAGVRLGAACGPGAVRSRRVRKETRGRRRRVGEDGLPPSVVMGSRDTASTRGGTTSQDNGPGWPSGGLCSGEVSHVAEPTGISLDRGPVAGPTQKLCALALAERHGPGATGRVPWARWVKTEKWILSRSGTQRTLPGSCGLRHPWGLGHVPLGSPCHHVVPSSCEATSCGGWGAPGSLVVTTLHLQRPCFQTRSQ